MIRRDVIFEETKTWNWEGDQSWDSELTWSDDTNMWEESDDEGTAKEVANAEAAEAEPIAATKINQNEQGIEVREGRITRPPRYLSEYVTGEDITDEEDEVNMVEINDAADPVTYEEAKKSLK